MRSSSGQFIRIDLRFYEAGHGDLYTHLAAMPAGLRAEFVRHLASIGWLVHTGRIAVSAVPSRTPPCDPPRQGNPPPASVSHPLDRDLLAALEAQE